MDTTPATSSTPLPGVALITYEDGSSEYRYTDDLAAALATRPAAAQPSATQPQPIIIQMPAAPVAPSAPPAVRAERGRPLIEPWMTKGAAGLGLAGGTVALAPSIANAAAAFSVAAGNVLHVVLEVGGAAGVALIAVRLLGGRKESGGRVLEVVQTIKQEITQTTRIQK